MDRDQLAAIALRYDTTMSRAMLRALGIAAREPVRYGVIARVDRFDGVEQCMRQKVGVCG